MTIEDQKRLTEYHNKMVRDKHEIEHLTTEVSRLREALGSIHGLLVRTVPSKELYEIINDVIEKALTPTK